LVSIDEEILDKEKEYKELIKRYEEETANIDELKKLKDEYKKKKEYLEIYEEKGDFERSGELKYFALPSLEEGIAKVEEKVKNNSVRRCSVKREDVAFAVSRNIGIPLNKILVDEQRKLLFL